MPPAAFVAAAPGLPRHARRCAAGGPRDRCFRSRNLSGNVPPIGKGIFSPIRFFPLLGIWGKQVAVAEFEKDTRASRNVFWRGNVP